ncbi:hypothetical protein Q4E93_21020 [Flavitalea sp. BT771]|uniref:hypothetical protein n=1 Tax=Flavitalea sp. BT771 TaxID=3063329 RepID=UPI0026E2BA5D|nr:hypothetical protein [Flavitalea sp. BT771]MDO6433104.1 hypothetical protein [Flavitalea sp. BT771]MDV6221620.1 hypothetical protein [Flavitalea sp. BT771]
MNAYKPGAFDHHHIHSQATEALQKGVIDKATHDRIVEAYPDTLYTPNFFVRMGLFLLAVLAAACGSGLLALMGLSSETAFRAMVIIAGFGTIAALELFIQRRSPFRAGLDDGLLYAAVCLIYFGITFETQNFGPTLECLILLVIALVCSIRYVDALMGLVAYGAFLGFIYSNAVHWGDTGRALLPFILMIASLAPRPLLNKLVRREVALPWRYTLHLLQAATLVTFYLAGNYYVVREANALISGVSGPIPMAWLWWTLTVLTPFVYITWGIRKKDPIFLWVGMALVTAAVFTFRYYYHVLPAELAMVIAGVVLIVLAYLLIRYLRIPRNGFTSAPADEPHPLDTPLVEGLIVAETFQPQQPADAGLQFGGGSGGGGGAGGEY